MRAAGGRAPLAAAAALGLISGCTAGSSDRLPPLPAGASAAIDGHFGTEEWEDARRIALPQGGRLLVRRAGGDLLLGVKLPPGAFRYVDLYVRDAEGRLLNFHASMRQGERLLPPGWSDASPTFTWGDRPGWQSSIARRTGAPASAPIAEQLHPLEGYEMRIAFSRLGPCPIRFRLEVRDFMGEKPEWVYPAGTSRADFARWASIRCPR